MKQIELTKPLVFIDVESTGTNPKEDYIVSIALVKILPDAETLKFYSFVKPPIPIPKSCSDVHGITDENVKNEKPFAFIAMSVMLMINDCDIAGFNSTKFDIPLIYNELLRAGINWDWRKSNFLDVGNLYKIKEPRTLGAAYKFYLGEEIEDAHNALADVASTMEVFYAQLSKYEDFEGKTIPELALMSNFDREIVDLDGVFRKDEDGDLVFNIGKNKDKKAKSDTNYLDWIVNKSTFGKDIKDICKGILADNYFYTHMKK